ncbi:hypothetical protein BS78_06G127000 [Paspalum vaginatum]|nr:hypothetical protein BS78_06G127000 [Paspalum vaginatum]
MGLSLQGMTACVGGKIPIEKGVAAHLRPGGKEQGRRPAVGGAAALVLRSPSPRRRWVPTPCSPACVRRPVAHPPLWRCGPACVRRRRLVLPCGPACMQRPAATLRASTFPACGPAHGIVCPATTKAPSSRASAAQIPTSKLSA